MASVNMWKVASINTFNTHLWAFERLARLKNIKSALHNLFISTENSVRGQCCHL